jgi:heme/copper-type cytochrome/quinol oxidase subunit 2
MADPGAMATMIAIVIFLFYLLVLALLKRRFDKAIQNETEMPSAARFRTYAWGITLGVLVIVIDVLLFVFQETLFVAGTAS